MGIQMQEVTSALRALAVGDHENGLLQMLGKRAVLEVAADLLTAYVDTGLEPEEIPTGLELAKAYAAMLLLKRYQALGTVEELAALVKARDEGRVVVLPCKRQELLEMLSDLKSVGLADAAETYTTGYRNGYRNGRIELLQYILQIPDGTRAEAEAALGGGGDG